jgi:hypothetical protein
MTRAVYLEKRNALMAAAKQAWADGDMETFDARSQEVDDLEDRFEAEAVALADFEVLHGLR